MPYRHCVCPCRSRRPRVVRTESCRFLVEVLCHLAEPPHVHPYIIRQLRVEARRKDVSLAHGHDVPRLGIALALARPVDASARLAARQPRHGLDGSGVKHGLDDGGADEDAAKRARRLLLLLFLVVATQKRQLEVGDKRLDLATKVVAVDAHGEPADEGLAALLGRGGDGLVGEQDGAGAGAPDGAAFGDEGAQRVEEGRLGGEVGDGRRLAAGDQQGGAAGEVGGRADGGGVEGWG
ncbi:hypothetical protein VDGD_21657 [Verticillium dahliae]|nr:hypothetical protein VDGD_21657 [Verticillium dahliae]